jgi:hypothetical protein
MWTAQNRGRYDRSQLRYPSDLTDDEWTLTQIGIYHFSPPPRPPAPILNPIAALRLLSASVRTDAASRLSKW